MIIGLTGSFGSGKSSVARIFKKSGAVIIDADKIAKGVLKSEKNKIAKEFGCGSSSRKKLAEIVFSDEPIDVPLFEEADIGLQLSKTLDPTVHAKHVLVESSACNMECKKCELRCPVSDRIPFEKLAVEQFNNPIFVNMIALGRLLSKIGINIENINFASEFPPQFFDENVKAIRYGYTYQD